MPNENGQSERSKGARWILLGGVALGVLVVAAVVFFIWSVVSESRRKARAEEVIHSALSLWCSEGPLPDVLSMVDSDTYYFSEFGRRRPTDPRPTGYQVTGITRGEKGTYLVATTLSFPGGAETRLYQVEVNSKSWKCSIDTKASEDVSGTEDHARRVLRAWLDCWVAGESVATFKEKHPEAAGKWNMDISRATLTGAGKKLVQYDITSARPATGGGYHFTVTATLDAAGKPETQILRYTVAKDRTLSGGRWCITGTQ